MKGIELKIKLKKLRQKNKDKSAIIFANGPSINSINFELIKENKNLITLMTNQIADVCKINKFVPDFYTAFFCEPLRGKKYKLNIFKNIYYPGKIQDALIAQKNILHLTQNNTTECFVNDYYKVFMHENKKCNFVKPKLWDRFHEFPEKAFEKFKLPRNFLWHVATTPLFQLCFYFDIKNIAIIGQDGYFINRESNHYKNYIGYEHSEYHKMESANKRISKLLEACNYYAAKKGIKIYNLSLESKFEQFEKITYEEFEKKN